MVKFEFSFVNNMRDTAQVCSSSSNRASSSEEGGSHRVFLFLLLLLHHQIIIQLIDLEIVMPSLRSFRRVIKMTEAKRNAILFILYNHYALNNTISAYFMVISSYA